MRFFSKQFPSRMAFFFIWSSMLGLPLQAHLLEIKGLPPIDSEEWKIAHYGEESLSDLHHTGYVTFDGTCIDNVHVKGYVICQFAKFSDFFVHGHAKVQDSTVKRMHIIGKLLAINADFKESLSCQSQSIVLSHCRSPGLTIKRIPHSNETQIVELTEFCEIRGPIQFESKNGKVIADKASKIGRVIGGSLEIR